MKICFLVSQNAALFDVCRDALAKVASNIELRSIHDNASYIKAAATKDIVLVIIECTEKDRNNPAFHAMVRQKLRIVQDNRAIPLIYTDPELHTNDADFISVSDKLVVPASATPETWARVIARALGITDTCQSHGDIDDIYEEFTLFDVPVEPEILPPDELLLTAKPSGSHQFNIHISEAWKSSENATSLRHNSSAIVHNISYHDEYIAGLTYRKRPNTSKAHVSLPNMTRISTEKADKPSLLNRIFRWQKFNSEQSGGLNHPGSPPKVPRLIKPVKPAASNQVISPKSSAGILSVEHNQPPKTSTGFNLNIGSISEQKILELPSENILPITSSNLEISAFKHEDDSATPEMLDSDSFRPQDNAKFSIGGAFKHEENHENVSNMLSVEDIRQSFEEKSDFNFNMGGQFASHHHDSGETHALTEIMTPEELLASAEKYRQPFEFSIYPSGHPGFIKADDMQQDECCDDDDEYLPSFQLDNDDKFSFAHVDQAHTEELAKQISDMLDASVETVLRTILKEELLPVIERRIDEKFETLVKQMTALFADRVQKD